jgi:hypothetical protein
MRKNNKALIDAEEQLVSGHSLGEMRCARDKLRLAIPDCLLFEAAGGEIPRTKAVDLPPRLSAVDLPPRLSAWGA